MRLTSREIARLEGKIMPVTESGCWLWTASTKNGYGQINIRGKITYAHRLAFELYVGRIPRGMNVLHRCDTPSCIRPDHLYIGTQKDNVADMDDRGRRVQMRGIDSGKAKLTENQVLSIRRDTRTQQEIAKTFGISTSQVGVIRLRQQWRHL